MLNGWVSERRVEIELRGGLLAIEWPAPDAHVYMNNVRANAVIVAGAVRGNITTQKLEIRASGRVWGDVITTAFVTDEGAFLRGQIRMEETVELGLESTEPAPSPGPNPTPQTGVPAPAGAPQGESGDATIVRRRKKAAQEPRP